LWFRPAFGRATGLRGHCDCRLAVMPSQVRTHMIQRRRGHHSVVPHRRWGFNRSKIAV
jgi:hypothetical protein